MTQRNYLFATGADDVALTRLIATAAKVTGFLRGAPGGPLPGWYRAGDGNKDFIQTMHQRVLQTYPKAGAVYATTRSWNNLTWQPVYLAVIAVHVHGALPELSGMSQSRQNLDVDGFRLPSGPQFEGSVEEMIERAGKELRAMADVMLAELNAVAKLRQVPANRLLADWISNLMIRLGHYRPELTIEERMGYAELWLKAMGLEGLADLDVLTLDGGRRVLIRKRKGCCLDYLIMPDHYCISCPKQDDGARIRRQRHAAIAEGETAG